MTFTTQYLCKHLNPVQEWRIGSHRRGRRTGVKKKRDCVYRALVWRRATNILDWIAVDVGPEFCAKLIKPLVADIWYSRLQCYYCLMTSAPIYVSRGLWTSQYFFLLFIPARVTRLKLTANLQSDTRERNTQKTDSKFILMTERELQSDTEIGWSEQYRMGAVRKKKKKEWGGEGCLWACQCLEGSICSGLVWKSSLSAQRGNGGEQGEKRE